jgi:(2Fe-2S) ferredoxin
VLLARRHHRAHRGATFQAMLCVPARRLLLRTTFADPTELVDLDLEAVGRGQLPTGAQGALHWEEVAGPVYGICTHGRHDACCAERGRPVCQALSAVRPEETWEVSHVGGDRFAPNLVVLPEGLYYGRLTPESVPDVVALHEEGRLDLDRLRGRSSYPMPAQYAEIALRRHLGEDRLDALRLVHREERTCEFRHGEDRWRVVVDKSFSGSAQMTCSATTPGRVAVFEAVTIEQL